MAASSKHAWTAAAKESAEKQPEKPQDSAEKDSAEKEPEGCAAKFKHHAALQVVGATSFATGLAWRKATLAIADPKKHSEDPEKMENLGTLWLITALSVLIFVVVIGILVNYSMDLQRRAKDESLKGDKSALFFLRSKSRSVNTIVSWGLTFATAAQIDTAIKATVPKDPVGWRLLYLCLVLVLVCLLVVSCNCLVFKEKTSRVVPKDTEAQGGTAEVYEMPLAIKLSDVMLSGSAYAMALSTLSVSEALLKLDKVSKSEDLGYIAIYTSVWVVVATALLALLACSDTADERETKSKLAASKSKELRSPYTFSRALRKLLSKVFAMIPVLACYALLYVAVAREVQEGDASVHDPLPIKGALIVMAVAFVITIPGGFLFKLCFKASSESLAAVDRDFIPGTYDDSLLDLVEAVTRTTGATVLESLSWLDGCALHALTVAFWSELVKEGKDVANVMASCGFALLLTILAVLAAFCIMPDKDK